MPNARTFPFRWVLPLAQLCLCAAMLWPMWPGLTNQVEGSLREYGLLELRMRNLNAPPRPIPLDFSDPQVQRIVSRNQLREWIVLALNGPRLPRVAAIDRDPRTQHSEPQGNVLLDVARYQLARFRNVFLVVGRPRHRSVAGGAEPSSEAKDRMVGGNPCDFAACIRRNSGNWNGCRSKLARDATLADICWRWTHVVRLWDVHNMGARAAVAPRQVSTPDVGMNTSSRVRVLIMEKLDT
jgi:hypothetical protein